MHCQEHLGVRRRAATPFPHELTTWPVHLMEPFGFFPVPLERPNTQIRLLQIDRDAAEHGLSVRLTTHSFEDAPPFFAISYTWGEDSEAQDIWIDGKICAIRKNCHFALGQARLHHPGDLFWIDMLCINQKDSNEKSAQVQKMWHIFSRAQTVLVCIGPHADDSRFLLGLTSSSERPGLSEDSRVDGSRIVLALECLAARSYWIRLWIVQEVVAARSLKLLCGEDLYDWSKVETLFELIFDCASEHADLVESEVAKSLQDVYRSRFYARYAFFSVDQVLATFRRFKCADVRDRVYGTLPLVNWSEQHPAPLPDYSLPPFQLAVLMTKHMETSHIPHLADALEIDLSNADLRDAISRRRSGKVFGDRSVVAGSDRIQMRLDNARPLKIDVTESGEWTTSLAPSRGTSTAPYQRESLLDAIQALPEHIWNEFRRRKPKQLSIEHRVAAFVCGESLPEDILIPLHNSSSSVVEPCVFLVVRERDSTESNLFNTSEDPVRTRLFDIIGQGFAMPGYRLPSKTKFNIDATLSLTGEDLLVLYTQDIYKGVSLSTLLPRLVTSVTAVPWGAVSITKIPSFKDEWPSVPHRVRSHRSPMVKEKTG